jgi:hypothetical protein
LATDGENVLNLGSLSKAVQSTESDAERWEVEVEMQLS